MATKGVGELLETNCHVQGHLQDAEDPDKPTSDAEDDDLKDRNDLHVLHRVERQDTRHLIHRPQLIK